MADKPDVSPFHSYGPGNHPAPTSYSVPSTGGGGSLVRPVPPAPHSPRSSQDDLEEAPVKNPYAVAAREPEPEGVARGSELDKKWWWGLLGCTLLGLVLFVAMYIPFLVLLTASDGLSDEAWEYDYFGLSPPYWANFSEGYYACRNGTRQSPINIVTADAVPGFEPLPPVEPAVPSAENSLGVLMSGPQNSNFKQSFNKSPILTCSENCGNLTMFSRQYALDTIYYRAPSEHAIDGVRYAMEAQLIFTVVKGMESQSAPTNVQVSVLYASPLLRNSSDLSQFWFDYMNISSMDDSKSRNFIQVNNLYSPTSGYRQYLGSMSIPPCTENTVVLVQNVIMAASQDQTSYLQRLVGFPSNARDLQESNGRRVEDIQPQRNQSTA